MNDAALRRALAQINATIAEPISVPQLKKVKKMPKKIPRFTQKEVREISSGTEHRKPPRRLIRKQREHLETESPLDSGASEIVTLTMLAEEAGMQTQLARLHLRQAGFERPGTRWQWQAGTRELQRVRKILKLRFKL